MRSLAHNSPQTTDPDPQPPRLAILPVLNAKTPAPPIGCEKSGLAAHSSQRTTKLYDRTSDAVSLDEVERVVF